MHYHVSQNRLRRVHNVCCRIENLFLPDSDVWHYKTGKSGWVLAKSWTPALQKQPCRIAAVTLQLYTNFT